MTLDLSWITCVLEVGVYVVVVDAGVVVVCAGVVVVGIVVVEDEVSAGVVGAGVVEEVVIIGVVEDEVSAGVVVDVIQRSKLFLTYPGTQRQPVAPLALLGSELAGQTLH